MSKIIYHGHSFVELHIKESIIFIDPFISGNPLCDLKSTDVKCDYIILSHAHGDHFGNTMELARKNNATVIAMIELADYLETIGIKNHAMNIGGCFRFPFGRVKLTIAHHSSSLQYVEWDPQQPGVQLPNGMYAGEPAGILINTGEKTIFHAGDTALFYDMKLIGEINKVDFALLPIGDNFTMGVDDAVKAAEFLNADSVIPIHYNTFDVIKADVNDFKRKIESIGRKCYVMKAGEKLSL